MVKKKIRLDLKDISNRLEILAKEIKSDAVKLELLDRGMRGDRRGYDFTGTSNFFREHYPVLEKLFYELKGKGILGRYIKGD